MRGNTPRIAFVTPNGGSGKTTATVLFASELVEREHEGVILDLPPNQSLAAWGAQGAG
jgi:chromosome partitioning protein